MEDGESKGLTDPDTEQPDEDVAGKPNESLLKSRYYFDMEDAAREVKERQDDFEKVISSAKFAGKLLSNVGVFGVKLGARAVEHAPAIAAKMAEHTLDNGSELSDEERARLGRLVGKTTWGDYASGARDTDNGEHQDK